MELQARCRYMQQSECSIIWLSACPGHVCGAVGLVEQSLEESAGCHGALLSETKAA